MKKIFLVLFFLLLTSCHSNNDIITKKYGEQGIDNKSLQKYDSITHAS